MKPQLFIVLFLIISISCTNSARKEKVAPLNPEKIAETINPDNQDDMSVNIRNGKAVFIQYCATCHMADGSGVRDLQPPLTDPKWISNTEQFVRILEEGISGKIDVNGQLFNNLMPTHKHLSNQEMANVISYVRSSFGNSFEPVSAKEVSKIRKRFN